MSNWFPTTISVIAAALMIYETYALTWKAVLRPGTYEARRPGEFSKDKKQYIVNTLPDKREFQFIPPAPESAGLIRFTSPRAGLLYIDGLPKAPVYACEKGGCFTMRIDATVFTLSGCPM